MTFYSDFHLDSIRGKNDFEEKIQPSTHTLEKKKRWNEFRKKSCVIDSRKHYDTHWIYI